MQININTCDHVGEGVVGHVRENDVTQVVFDLTGWIQRYGLGTVALSVMRQGDYQPYPVPIAIEAGGRATWTVSATDTAKRGHIKAQLTYMVGTKVKKTCVYLFAVRDSLPSDGPAPEPYESWLEVLQEFTAETSANAQRAKQSEDNAKVSEDNAKISEQNAKQSEDNAEQSALSAGQSATSAGQSAESASQSAISASQSASEAENHRINAWGGAISSQEAMHDAQRHANDAKSYRNTAYTYQTNAYTYKESARGSAESASQSAQSAGASAQSAASDAQTASTAAASAITSEANAEHYADLAAQHAERAGYVIFDVDESTGEAIVTVTDAVDEAMTFIINEETGELEVTLV